MMNTEQIKEAEELLAKVNAAVEKAAKVAHATERAFVQAVGGEPTKPWSALSADDKEIARRNSLMELDQESPLYIGLSAKVFAAAAREVLKLELGE